MVSTFQGWRFQCWRHKPPSGQPKIFEEKELEALLEQDQSQTQEELAESLGITQQTVSVRLRVMGMIQKQGNWVPYELKPRDLKGDFSLANSWFKDNREKIFLHRIVIGDEKWIFYDNPKKKKYAKSDQSLPSISTSTPAEHSFEDHALYLVGPKGSCLLWAAKICRFHYGRSVSVTIDSFEPWIARKIAAGIRAKTR